MRMILIAVLTAALAGCGGSDPAPGPATGTAVPCTNCSHDAGPAPHDGAQQR